MACQLSNSYNGYLAVIEYDQETRVFYGEVTGLHDVITFQGNTVDEAEQAFHESLDDYLAFCAARDKKPE